MPGPYVRDGHYMYGNVFIQPYPAYYNSSWYHRKPPRRFISDLEFFDDGRAYVPQTPTDPATGDVVRSETANRIVNIETLAFRSLRIKLYAMKEEDDTDIVLEIGKQYAITYVTEGGLKVANGILKIIDSSIPDTCTRYIGQFNETVATSWIGMDCSVAGKSDKRKIFVASIRAIEEVPEDDESYIPPTVDVEEMSDSEKLNNILNMMPDFNSKLDRIIHDLASDTDEVIDKLDELDPTQKLAYIISKLDDTSLFDRIYEHITETSAITDENVNSKSDAIISEIDNKAIEIEDNTNVIKTDILNSITNHSTEVNSKFAQIMQALGNMPYNDKIDYIYNQFVTKDINEENQTEILNTITEKTEAILTKLEELNSSSTDPQPLDP